MANPSTLKPAVILVADRTLSARYRVLFEGIFATMQTTQVPSVMMRHLLSPAVRTDTEGRASIAALGLRRVEASLLAKTALGPEDVVCTTPERLGDLLGPWLKVVGVCSSDPLGRGMSNTTTSNFWSGELYTRRWMRDMLTELLIAKQRYGFKVIGGGAGAWQWRVHRDTVADECLDMVFEGYFEKTGPGYIERLLNGWQPDEKFITLEQTAAEDICAIRGPSLMGAVELSRGCGRGCRFCSIAKAKMQHLPIDKILSDLETNVAGGVRSVVSGSEDFFRYGSDGLLPNFERLRNLLLEMRRINGLSFMQLDHANITSVAQMTDEQLQEIRRLLTWEKNSRYLWVNMGAESANGHLVKANAPGKVAPYRPEDWEGLLYDSARKMTRNGYFGVFSLVLGLPGETGRDVEQTLKFVRFLEQQNAIVFPVFYEPCTVEEIQSDYSFTLAKMRLDHLELYRRCYEINFKKVPLLFWDNQRCGGISWAKRALLQMLGKTEIFSWRHAFNSLEKKLKKKEQATPDKNVAIGTIEN